MARTAAALAFWLLLLVVAARAQENGGSPKPQPPAAADEQDQEVDLGVIRVEAPKAPASLPAPPAQTAPAAPSPTATASPRQAAAERTIPHERIEQLGASNAAEVISREPGLVVSDSFAGSQVNFEGLPGKFSEVTVDGQRLVGRILDQVDFSQLSLAGVDHIDVLRGPLAAELGPDSGGVVINLVTRAPEGHGGEASLGAGSLGYNQQRLFLYNGGKQRGWDFSVERALRESYDLNGTHPDTDGDSYRRYAVDGGYRQRFGSNELSLHLQALAQQDNGRGFSPPDLTRVLDTDTRRWQGSGSYKRQLGGASSLTLSQNYGTYRHEISRFFPGYPQTLQESGFTDTLWDSKLAYQREGRTGLRAGVERDWDHLLSDRISAGVAESSRYGGYLIASRNFGEWRVDAAVRADEQQGYGTQLTPKLGATLKLDTRSTLAFAAGAGYRAPSLRERFYEFNSPFGYTVLGNPDLKPEHSASLTADYDYKTDATTLSVGAFHNDVSNLITFDQTQAVPQVFTTENVSRATSDGLKLSAERRWLVGGCDCPCCNSARHFGLGYDGVWLPRARDTQLGTRLAQAPRLDQRARAFYDSPQLNAEAAVHSLGSRFLDEANTSLGHGYQTLDLSLGHPAGEGVWRLSGLNVLDKKNARYGPKPGRELRVEYTLKF